MRVLILLLALLPLPALAQAGYDRDGPYEGVFADHRSDGDNGSVRVGNRVGGTGQAMPATVPTGTLVQPGNSSIHIYQPKPLNDLALDYKAKHPGRPH
jgi:hypothetical protein